MSDAMLAHANWYPAATQPNPSTPLAVALGAGCTTWRPSWPVPVTPIRITKQITMGNQSVDSIQCTARIPRKEMAKEITAIITMPTVALMDL